MESVSTAPDEIDQKLTELGAVPDEAIPLAETALRLSLAEHPGRSFGAYENHIVKMAYQVDVRYGELLDAGAEDDVETRIAALKHILCDQHGYSGDTDTYNDLRNADLMEVIDRRKGMPIALAILTLELGRRQGWACHGLNFPGHFLVRLDKGSKRVISDPFNQFRILQAHDLRELLKSVAGAGAELSSAQYQEAGNRDILLRLQNNIKFRRIEREDYAGALKTVALMKAFAPGEHRLFLDESVLKARLGDVKGAIVAVKAYLEAMLDPKDRYEAEVLLRTLETTE